MGLRPGDKVVKTGYFLYQGRARCPIRIVQTNMLPGTGDYEDPPEISDDQYGPFFRLDMTAAGSPDFWASSVEGFKSVDAAMAHLATGVVWDE